MQTADELSRRIAVIEDLGSVVRTMKALSAVSMRHYETAAAAISVYHKSIELGFQAVLQSASGQLGLRAGSAGGCGFVLFGSDNGLCGRFNEVLLDFAKSHLRERNISLDASGWLAVGHRMADRLTPAGCGAIQRLDLPSSVDGLAVMAGAAIVEVDRWQRERGIDRVLVFHHRRAALNRPLPVVAQLLPADQHYFSQLARRRWHARGLPTFRQRPEELLSALMQQHLFVALFRAGAESLLAEHAARLAAMQAAERNIAEKLEDMRAEHRRARQNAITAEIQDIVAGYEVLGRR